MPTLKMFLTQKQNLKKEKQLDKQNQYWFNYTE